MKLTTTSTEELSDFAKRLKIPHFKVLMTDLLSKRVPKHINAIINVDRAEGSGTHWVAVHSGPKQEHVIYFDPFGMPPDPAVLSWMKGQETRLVIGITTQLQELDASSCGYWCLYFLKQLNAGVEVAEFLAQFDAEDQVANEKRLEEIFEEYR